MTTTEIRRFRRALRRFGRLHNEQLKQCCTDVTFAQCLVLLEVDEAKQVSVGGLASELRLDVSTLSRSIETLVQKGLVERRRSDEDRRTVHIVLTDEGTRVCRQIHRDNDACVRELFDRIPVAERDAVIRNFETLVEAYAGCEADTAAAGESCGLNRERSGR